MGISFFHEKPLSRDAASVAGLALAMEQRCRKLEENSHGWPEHVVMMQGVGSIHEVMT